MPEMEKVTVPAGARVTVAATLPLPVAGQVEPAVAEQVHAAPDSDAGSVSVTVAPVTVLGPGFVTTMV